MPPRLERNEVSIHEVRLYLALRRAGPTWRTSRELAAEARVADRTARLHLLRFVHLGVADQAEVFPAHRYRIAEFAPKRNAGYMLRLDRAVEAFGETV